MQKVVILGGGISGLSLAHFIDKSRYAVTLLESSGRCGGWLQTKRLPEGHMVECGARSLSPKPHNIAALSQLISDLNMENELICVPNKSEINKNRYLLHNGEVERVSSNPVNALRSTLTKHLPIALLKDLCSRRKEKVLADDESVYDFFARRFHSSIGDGVMSAFVHGIYGGDVRRWSMEAQFPRMLQLERKYGSVLVGVIAESLTSSISKIETRGLPHFATGSFHSFNNGLETLPKTLCSKLVANNVDLRLSSPVCGVQLSKAGGVSILVKEQQIVDADIVVSTLPAGKLRSILIDSIDLNKSLDQFRANTMAPVTFVWNRRVDHLRPTIGVLVPHRERIAVAGVICDHYPFSSRQPSADCTVITVVVGGDHLLKEIPVFDEGTVFEYAHKFIREKLGIVEQPDHVDISIHNDCMPQYDVGHLTRVERFRTQLANQAKGYMYAIGASFDGIGIPDCINGAHTMANIINRLPQKV